MKYKKSEIYVFHQHFGEWISPEGVNLKSVCHDSTLLRLADTEYTAQFHVEDDTFKYVFVNGRNFVRVYMYWK